MQHDELTKWHKSLIIFKTKQQLIEKTIKVINGITQKSILKKLRMNCHE